MFSGVITKNAGLLLDAINKVCYYWYYYFVTPLGLVRILKTL